MNRCAARLLLSFFAALSLTVAVGPASAFPWKRVYPTHSAPPHAKAKPAARKHVAPKQAAPTQVQVAQSPLEAGVLAQINGLRHQHGLSALRLSPQLTVAARQHSAEMTARGYFGHSSANGASFDRRIARFYPVSGSRFWSVGENLLWSSPDVDPAGALQLWLNSPPHREILMTARWREIGLSAVHVASAPGTFGGRTVTVVTADFGVRR